MVYTNPLAHRILALPDSNELLGIDRHNSAYAIPAASAWRHPLCRRRARRFLRELLNHLPSTMLPYPSITAVQKAIRPLSTRKSGILKDCPTVKQAFCTKNITFDPELGSPEKDKKHATEENPDFNFNHHFLELMAEICVTLNAEQIPENKPAIIRDILQNKIPGNKYPEYLIRFILEYLYALFLYNDETELAEIVKPVLARKLEGWMTSRSAHNKCNNNIVTSRVPDKIQSRLKYLKGQADIKTKAGFNLFSDIYREWEKKHKDDIPHLCAVPCPKPKKPTQSEINENKKLQQAKSLLPPAPPCFAKLHPSPEEEPTAVSADSSTEIQSTWV